MGAHIAEFKKISAAQTETSSESSFTVVGGQLNKSEFHPSLVTYSLVS